MQQRFRGCCRCWSSCSSPSSDMKVLECMCMRYSLCGFAPAFQVELQAFCGIMGGCCVLLSDAAHMGRRAVCVT